MRVFIDGELVECKTDVRIVHDRDRSDGGDVHLIHNSEGMVIDIVDEKPGVFESPVTASTSIMVESLAEMAEIASAPDDDVDRDTLGGEDVGAIDIDDLENVSDE